MQLLTRRGEAATQSAIESARTRQLDLHLQLLA